MLSQIRVTDSSPVAVIDIEGVIGVPEQMQFEEPSKRIATYAGFAASLASIREVKAREIVVNIRSTGGDVHDALLIFDALQGLDAEVRTRCYGYVASAATIIAQAASPGCREVSANTLYLIHCSESTAEGNSKSLAVAKELLDKTDMRIASLYAHRSGRSVADYIDLMNANGGKGRWITAEEVVEAGLADAVIPAGLRNCADVVPEELADLCRLFGLTPPPQSETEGDPDPVVGVRISTARTLWRTFRRLFGSSRGVGTLAENAHPAPASTIHSDHSDVKIESHRKPLLPQDKTVIMERVTAQSEARQTMTQPIEDPAIEDYRPTPNEAAYQQDVDSIKARL